MAGQPVSGGLTRDEHAQHAAEERAMRAHPGFEHLLQVVHFCPSLPCILMEPCDGSADALYRDSTLLYERYIFAKDVLLAMEYLRDVAGLANADLKFDNVMYKRTRSGGYSFVLVDYGGCSLINEPWGPHSTHTPGFSPPFHPRHAHGLPVWNPAVIGPLPVSIYNYAAMLLFLFMDHVRPDMRRGCAFVVRRAERVPFDPLHTHRITLPIMDILRAHPDDVPHLLPALRQAIPGMPPPYDPRAVHNRDAGAIDNFVP